MQALLRRLDRNLPRRRRFLFGKPELEHPVLQVGADVVGVNRFGKAERPGEAAVLSLDAPIAALGLVLLDFAFAAERENVLLDVDLDLICGQARNLSVYVKGVVLFADVHRDLKRLLCKPPTAQKAVLEAIHLFKWIPTNQHDVLLRQPAFAGPVTVGSSRDATIAPQPSSNDGCKLSMESVLSTLELTAFSGAIGYRQMRVSTLVLLLAVMGGTLLVGCVDDVRFNPSGCDVHVRGRWLVDGQNPTAETCGNIALVELAIIDDLERQFWAAPEFTLRCDALSDSNAVVIDGEAYLDTILVTRNRCGGTGKILGQPPDTLPQEYKSRWRATTSLKFVVDCSPIQITPITTIDGGTDLILDVGTVDFRTLDAGVECPAP